MIYYIYYIYYIYIYTIYIYTIYIYIYYNHIYIHYITIYIYMFMIIHISCPKYNILNSQCQRALASELLAGSCPGRILSW